MAKRQNLKIQTKYKTIEECKENCIDRKEHNVNRNIVEKDALVGKFTPENFFEITGRGWRSSLFVFKGQIVEEQKIYMVGNISPKRRSRFFSYFAIFVGLILGGILITPERVAYHFFGYLMIIVPWIHFSILMTSDALYDKIIDKVQG